MMFSAKKTLLLLIATLLIDGCSTKYQQKGWWDDGYSEIITNPDSFIVNFSANSATSHEKVLQYALLRASELTLERGYKYFAVTRSQDRTSSYEYTETRHNQSGTSDADLKSKKTDAKHEKSSKLELKQKASARHEEKGSSSTYTKTVVKPALTLYVKCFMEKPEVGEVYDAAFFWDANKETG